MKNIIIDTDPGVDDAIAILLAAKHFHILGITTVHGNAPVDRTTKNVLKILEFSDLTHIPVVCGAEDPLVQPRRHAASIHGKVGWMVLTCLNRQPRYTWTCRRFYH